MTLTNKLIAAQVLGYLIRWKEVVSLLLISRHKCMTFCNYVVEVGGSHYSEHAFTYKERNFREIIFFMAIGL